MPEMTAADAAEKLEEFIHYPKLGYAKNEDITLFQYAASILRRVASGELAPVIHAHGQRYCENCGAILDGKDDEDAE